MYIYAANTYFYTPVYVLDSGGIWWGSAATGSQMTPTIAILNYNKYFTALPSTASFTTLTIGANAVATEAFVTGKNFLTALPKTVALLAGPTFTGNVSPGPYSFTCGTLNCSSITPPTNIIFSVNNYTFCEATPTQIGYLSGVTPSIQTHLGTCLKMGVSNTVAEPFHPVHTSSVVQPSLSLGI